MKIFSKLWRLTFHLESNRQFHACPDLFAIYFPGFPGWHGSHYTQGFLVQSIADTGAVEHFGLRDVTLFIDDEADMYDSRHVVIDGLLRIVDAVIDVLIQRTLSARELWRRFRAAIDLGQGDGSTAMSCCRFCHRCR